jgi:hypothetical protein
VRRGAYRFVDPATTRSTGRWWEVDDLRVVLGPVRRTSD